VCAGGHAGYVHGDRIAEAGTFEGRTSAGRDHAATWFETHHCPWEDEFRIEISDRDSEGLRTVGDVLALIRTKLH
jgi:hypothetical protein